MTKGKFKVILILVLLSAGIFLLQIPRTLHPNNELEVVNASDLSVVINEIAWMGTVVSSAKEWMELKNLKNEEIDLTGWTLKAGDGQPAISLSGKILANGYFLLERTNDDALPGVISDFIYTGALGNNGEVLELRDSQNNLIDNFDASTGWPAGDNTTKATMERKVDGTWQTSQNPGGTPKAENSSGMSTSPQPSPSQGEGVICGDGHIDDNEECDDGNNINNDGCTDDCRIEAISKPESENDVEQDASSTTETDEPHPNPLPALPAGRLVKETENTLGDVVINELVSDPSDGETEWLEIYNKSNTEINLTGWIVEDGSGAKTALSGTLGTDGTTRFLVLEKPKGNLNNAGDIIFLRDQTGRLIDQVAYGQWDDGNLDNNAPAATDPFSLARQFDGYNTFNNINDFKITSVKTKGASNIINNPEEAQELSEEDLSAYDYSENILISEIFPNPIGPDNEKEFIELYNAGAKDVNLFGWALGDESQKKYEFIKEKIIQPGQYLVIERKESKIALNNGGDSVKLYQPLKELQFVTIKYAKAKEGWSYVDKRISTISEKMNTKQEWVWTEIATPGKANEIKTINHEPIVDFDSPESAFVGQAIIFDSSDTVDEDGDTLKFTWDFGDQVKNNLSAPEHTFLKAGNFTIKLTVDDGTNKKFKEKIIKITNSGEDINVLGWQSGQEVFINEIMPDPEGSDETGEWIEIYNQSETKVNLLDWRLEDSRGEKSAYEFKDDKWLDINKYLVIMRTESKLALNNNGDLVRLYDNTNRLMNEVKYIKTYSGQSLARTVQGEWQWTIKPTPGQVNQFLTVVKKTTAKKTNSAKSKVVKKIINTNLEKIRELAIGDTVKVRGTVAVLPGVFGVQYFYIVGSPGMQIYNYKKDFPKLAVGDYVEVTGEISEVNSEKRIKTASALDIKFIEHRQPPVAQTESCEKISEDLYGNLIVLNGEVADRKGSTVYLDDGTEEAVVYLKKGTGIKTASVKMGDKLAITGIVGLTKSGVQLMPRSEDDIKNAAEKIGENGEILGEISKDDEWQLGQRDKKTELFKYLLIIAGGIIVVLLILFIKMEIKRKEKERK
jgi:cysteine-rich repeat protein